MALGQKALTTKSLLSIDSMTEELKGLLSTLTIQEKIALGMFKALELFNISAIVLGDQIEPDLRQKLARSVRQIMRDRLIIVGNSVFDLNQVALKQIIDTGAKKFYIGRHDRNSTEWKEACEYSNTLMEYLDLELLYCLALLGREDLYRHKLLATEVLKSLEQFTTTEDTHPCTA